MSESKKPITRTRQEVKNIDIDESKYIKKEDQYAYGINTFTTENDNLTAMEIVSKDKGTTANVKVPSSPFSNEINSNISTYDSLYLNYGKIGYFQLYNCSTPNFSIGVNYKGSVYMQGYYGINFNGYNYFTFQMSSLYVKLPFTKTFYDYDYILTRYAFDKYIKFYQHTLNISKGNEFEGLIIKFTEKPTNVTTPTTINTPQLFIDNINYIKDVVGFILKDGIVTPYVFTYKDDTLYLNGTEIDVNSLTITDEVVTL